MTENLAAALAAFQAELPRVAKDSTAQIKSDKGSDSYRYADLAEITPLVLALLAKIYGFFGLRYTVTLSTRPEEAMGEARRTPAPLFAQGADVGGRADVVLADPPYGFDAWPELLAAVRADFVVAESAREIEPPPGWEPRQHGERLETSMGREVRLDLRACAVPLLGEWLIRPGRDAVVSLLPGGNRHERRRGDGQRQRRERRSV